MTKANIIDKISKDTHLTKKEIGVIVDSLLNNLKKCIADDEHIELRGFGTFGTKKRMPRVARNPKTNEKLYVPEHRVAYFKPGKELKDTIKYEKFE